MSSEPINSNVIGDDKADRGGRNQVGKSPQAASENSKPTLQGHLFHWWVFGRMKNERLLQVDLFGGWRKGSEDKPQGQGASSEAYHSGWYRWRTECWLEQLVVWVRLCV